MTELSLDVQGAVHDDGQSPSGLSHEEIQEATIGMQGLVRATAFNLIRGLPPHILVDDLIAEGNVGLLQALKIYKSSRSDLQTYVQHRAKGAMLDYLRSLIPTKNGGRDFLGIVRNARRILADQLGRVPTDEELATKMNMAPDLFLKRLERKGLRQPAPVLFPIEEAKPCELGQLGETAERNNPFVQVLLREIRQELDEAIRSVLDDRERLILKLYYVQYLNQREIGLVLGVTESRICQMRGEILEKLRTELAGLPHEDFLDE